MKRLSIFLMALMLMSIGAKAADEDVTATYIQNPSFETPDVAEESLTADETGDRAGVGAYVITADNLSATGWTLTNTPSVCDIMTADAIATDNGFGAPGAPSDGYQMLYLRDSWNSSATTTTLTQKVTLSAGTYKVTVDSKCIHNKTDDNGISAATAKLVANGEHAELPYHTGFVPDNWDKTSVTFVVDGNEGETTDVEIGVEIYYPQNQDGFSVLLDNFTLASVDDVELTAHYEEAEFSHWSISGNSGGSFQLNTWSTELDTESGMAVPFIEYWVGAGNVLSDATIKHQQLQGLPAGDYIVSVFARAFNEANGADADAVCDGITFTANTQSVDLITGTEGTFIKDTNTGYKSTERYGVYTLNCTVGEEGTLDIGFTVASEMACDWMAFKDLRVVMDTDTYPELTAPEGEMDPDVKEAMDEAIAAYKANPTGDNFFAAIEAIQEAYASIAIYASDLNGKDFLIMNSDGYYLAGGLDYGTHAILGGKPQFITFEAQTDGTYKLDTHQYNYGNHYFGTASAATGNSTDFYFDAAYPLEWTIEAVDGGYLISNTTVGYIKGEGFQKGIVTTTNYADATVWTLVTKDDVIAKMENATVDNPVDVTALIPAPEPKHNPWGGYYVYSGTYADESWIASGYNVEAAPNNYTFGQDGNIASCAESYHSNNGFDFHQTVNFPKAGYYILSSQAFYRSDDAGWGSTTDNTHVATMYAGNNSVQIYRSDVSNNITDYTPMANAYQDLLDGLHPLSLCLYIEADDTEMEVGFRSNYEQSDAKWNIFGELGLQYLGNDSYEGFVVHEAEAAVDDWSMTGTSTLDYNFWSSEADESGMVVPFMQYWVGSGNTLAEATISHSTLTGLYPGVYEVSLTIRVFSEAGNEITEGTTFNANNASEDVASGSDSNEDIFGEEVGVYGTYTLTCVVDGNGTLDISIVIPEGVTYNWISFKDLKVVYIGELSVDWDMTDAGYGTLILPFAAAVPEELVAYTIASVDEDNDEDGIVATLSLTASEAIAANTPYIMGGTENTYTFTGTPINEKDSYTITPVTGVSLTGTFVDMSYSDFTADGTEYLLQNHDGEGEGGVAFYPVVEDKSSEATLTPYHCYLTYSANGASPAKLVFSFAGTDDETTAIKAVESAEAEGNGAIYDLSGRKVSKAVKGVYIQNGKKVLVK